MGGEGARQGQPPAFAAGQHADRCVGLLGAEQEVFHVTDNVAGLAADRHRVAAAAGQRLRSVLGAGCSECLARR